MAETWKMGSAGNQLCFLPTDAHKNDILMSLHHTLHCKKKTKLRVISIVVQNWFLEPWMIPVSGTGLFVPAQRCPVEVKDFIMLLWRLKLFKSEAPNLIDMCSSFSRSHKQRRRVAISCHVERNLLLASPPPG